MLQTILNRAFVKYILTFLGLLISLYFGWSFYPFGDWVGREFLQDIPYGSLIFGWVCAVIMWVLVVILIFYKEYIKQDIREYVRRTGKDRSFEYAFNWLVFFVVMLELFSVVFRCILLGGSYFSIVLLGVGLVGMGLNYVIGKILYVELSTTTKIANATTMPAFSPIVEEVSSQNHNHNHTTPASF